MGKLRQISVAPVNGVASLPVQPNPFIVRACYVQMLCGVTPGFRTLYFDMTYGGVVSAFRLYTPPMDALTGGEFMFADSGGSYQISAVTLPNYIFFLAPLSVPFECDSKFSVSVQVYGWQADDVMEIVSFTVEDVDEPQ